MIQIFDKDGDIPNGFESNVVNYMAKENISSKQQEMLGMLEILKKDTKVDNKIAEEGENKIILVNDKENIFKYLFLKLKNVIKNCIKK